MSWGVNGMAEETGSFDSSKMAEQAAELFAKLIQETMTNCFGWFQNSRSVRSGTNLNSWLLSRATERMSAASIFINKLSRAADLQEVVKIQCEFVQTQMTMLNSRTKEIGDAVAVATNLAGAFVSILNWQKVLEDLARNSPTYRQTGGNERIRIWSAVAGQERHTTGERK
jgi:hypothetical protein